MFIFIHTIPHSMFQIDEKRIDIDEMKFVTFRTVKTLWCENKWCDQQFGGCQL